MTGPALADVLPLSPAQEGLLYHAELDDGGPDLYVVQSRFRVDSQADAAALRRAVDGLLARHQNLRACFRHRGLDRPVQVVPARVAVPWAEADLTGYGPAEADAELERLMAADLARRFDVSRPPLLRCTLARRAAGQADLLLTVHHILLDGWSMPVLARELGELYAGRGAELPAAPPYRAYLAWLSGLDFDAAARAWAAALAGAPPTLLAPGPPGGPRRPATAELTLPRELSDAVHRRARAAAVTVSTVIRAAWGLVLARMTGAGDVMFGTVASGRPPELAGVEAMVGLLANLLPARVTLRPGERAGEFLRRLQQEQLSLLPHQNARLSDVRRLTGVPELFDTVLAVQNYPRAGLAGTGTGPRLAEVRDGTHYPLTLSVITAQRLYLRLDYRPGQVSAEVARALLARFSRALELLAGAPDAVADRLEILPEAERRHLLACSAGIALPETGDTIPGQFAALAARSPDATAVLADGGELSCAELDARAAELAGRLAAAGVRRETPVALLAPRSPELVIAQLAVLKAGGCCVPLDPGQPEARLATVLRGSGARVLLASEPPGWTAGTVSVLPMTDRVPGEPDLITARGGAARTPARPVPPPRPGSAAYLMYTSGSTGEPKGVILTHRNVVELAAEPRFSPGRPRRVLLHSPHTFDASLYELWATLLTGGVVVIAPPGPVEPGGLEEITLRHRVTDAWLTAELFRAVADLRPGALAGLTQVWTGGDVVSPEAVRRVLRRCPRTTVINGYGPTEVTTFATCHEVPRPGSADPVPIGRPLGGTGAYVLDPRLRLAPAGAVGELYLSGTGLARGYAGEPAMTAGRFVAVPLAGEPGARMYRTGDLARWTARGLEFAGRADRQVKIRGHRAEPAEIEAVLERCPGVTRAVVSARPGPDGGQRLVASLVLEPGTDLTTIRRHAAALLPAPLVPTGYVPVGTLPLTGHGKVDRAALSAAPYREPPARAPRTPLEKSLCGVFAEVLDVPAGPDTDFFDAGGHSLLAMRLVAAVEAVTRTRLPISAVLECPTPAALAERLDGAGAGPALGRARLLTLRAAGHRAPLFCLHEGLGLAWSYAVLLRHLPDRPLYALQSPALGGGSPAPASIEELAETYLAQIRAVQPSGPYLLLGASFGGLLAYQLAARLRQAGERLGLVALLDAVPHRAFTEPGESLDAGLVEQSALVAVLGDHAPGLAAASGRLSRAAVFPAVRDGEGPLRGSDDRWLAILTDVCASHIRMALGYQPPRYDGTLTLFSARTEGISAAAKAAAWRQTAAGVRCHELDCAHGHILRPSPAAEIISFLAPELEEL